MSGNNFNDYTKSTIIEQVKNESLSKSKTHNLLEHREAFWILKF